MSRWQAKRIDVREGSIISIKVEGPQFEFHSPA
jgi:hypothetical protein